MSDKKIEINNLEEALNIIKSLQEELETVKKQLNTLQIKNKELENLSITDDLTGLYNQRHFFKTLEEEIERNKRQKHPLSLIFLDIDDLKAYNDAYGHAEGNEILRVVAKSISCSIRKNVDSGYRYGGDEFAVILPEVHSEEAVEIAKRINENLKKNDPRNIKLSSGISEFKPELDGKTLLANADKAMYKAKKTGDVESIDGYVYKICVY